MSSAPTTPSLRVEQLRVSFPSATGRFLAVNDVSFELRPGETFGLVGESGSGKTTTSMAILRLITPPGRIEGGSVRLGDVDLMSLNDEALRRARWSRIAFIPQGAMNSLNPVTKIKEQMQDVILEHEGRINSAQLRTRVIDLLKTVGLPERVYEQYPHELSGGMKQRVCIAMAVALSPEVIIADEPTSALDVVVQRKVVETLQSVQRRLNAAVLLIGHDMGLQAQVADRMGIMYRGKLVEMGPVRAIFKHPQHPYTRLLIASIPSIRAGTQANHTGESQIATAGKLAESWNEVPPETIPPLREVGPDHFAALA